MSPSEHPHAVLCRALRRWRRSQHGSAAIEFALVAPMFFGLLFAILEIGLTFFAGQVLENGLQQSARLMFTHQAADSNMTQQQFTDDLCSRVSMLLDCTKLRVNVSVTAEGAPITIKSPIDANGQFVDNFTYQNPQPNTRETVVVSAFYQWPLAVTQLGYSIANIDAGTANGKYLLASMAAFRVEPN
ncbi:MAG TPA: TadE/TadG family type IV pilus assembly protein [Xanthobacteraceae bacterium]|nr:TadE/TadG family type IV pilus assembly protein [Xanthobacteraceae bacterium]